MNINTRPQFKRVFDGTDKMSQTLVGVKVIRSQMYFSRAHRHTHSHTHTQHIPTTYSHTHTQRLGTIPTNSRIIRRDRSLQIAELFVGTGPYE